MMYLKYMYYKNDTERRNCEEVVHLLRRFPNLQAYQPNPTGAPWHWKIGNGHDSVNLWPHLMKGSLEGRKAVVGISRLNQLLEQHELLSMAGPEDFGDSLIETD